MSQFGVQFVGHFFFYFSFLCFLFDVVLVQLEVLFFDGRLEFLDHGVFHLVFFVQRFEEHVPVEFFLLHLVGQASLLPEQGL